MRRGMMMMMMMMCFFNYYRRCCGRSCKQAAHSEGGVVLNSLCHGPEHVAHPCQDAKGVLVGRSIVVGVSVWRRWNIWMTSKM